MGIIGGALACWGVGLKFKFGFDDSLDAVGVHLVAGLWGTIGLAFFSTTDGMFTDNVGDGFKLLVVQIIIALVAMVFAGVVTAIIAFVLGKTMGWRVDPEVEHSGIDGGEHRESAYEMAGQASVLANTGHAADSKPKNAPTITPRTDTRQ